MFRKLILASAVSLALLPGAAGALGLGGIRAESALNEPFSGQIDLLETKPDELAGVKVVLAPQAEFNKAGAPRSDFLEQLSFSAGVSAQGQSVIRVTSKEPVREPYLDFLIEVTWPSGRLVKEFTVLLDPPVTVDRAPPQIEQPAITTPELEQVARSEPPPEPARPASSVGAASFPLRYGPVESGAGLWRIARKMAKSSGATVAQTAMALYRNNQAAFIRGDINKLMVGKVLEIPTAAELGALDTAAADREFQAALRGETVTSTPLTDITAAPRPEDRLQIAGAAEPSPDGETTPEIAPEVPAESPEVASDGPTGEPAPPSGEVAAGVAEPELGTIRQDLLLVQEASESTRQASEELRSRVFELEKQLSDIQRLLKLSNERLAQLQAAGLTQSDVTPAAETDMPVPGDSEESAVGAGEGESTEIAAEPKPVEAAAEPQPQSDTESASGDAGQVPVEQPAAPAFWESVPRSMWALALTVPTLLLVLGWMIRRRRKSLEESLRPEDFSLDSPGGTVAGLGDAGSEAAEMSESSAEAASALSPYSGFGSLEDETEEADVISEADVYIAYGRYREAESLLEGEIERAPDRLDVKYKLAEAYYGARNPEGMGKLMRELQQAGGDRVNPDQWQRLNTMLRELEAPDAEVAESGSPAPGNGHPADRAPESVQPVAPPFTPPAAPRREPVPAVSANGFGAESDLFTAAPPSNDSQDRQSLEMELEVEELEVDTGDLEISVGEEMPEMAGAASDLELQLEDLESLRDVDLGSFTDRAPLSDSLSTEPPAAVTADVENDSPEVPSVGTDSLASDVLSSQWQMDSGMWDEVATKIDLARAYMEMEDPEAARVILEEVAEEGNESQQAEAKEMMTQLS